jgi:hypothetical protein
MITTPMNSSVRIALVTGASMAKPDPESHLLVAALARRGIVAELVPWDSAQAWASYRLVVVRTPWDYFARLDEFLGVGTPYQCADRLRQSTPGDRVE